MVIDKVREEAHQLHLVDLSATHEADCSLHCEPNWDPNNGGTPLLEHYGCILMSLRKGVPRQKSLNKIQELKQEPNEDPSEFLERLYQAYRRYTGAHSEAHESMRMVNITFVRQSTPDTRRKLQKLDGAFGMKFCLLAEIAFKVFNNREQCRNKVKNRRRPFW